LDVATFAGWPQDDRAAASAKMTRETVASVRAVRDLSPASPFRLRSSQRMQDSGLT